MSRQKFMIPCDPNLFEYVPEDVSDEEVFEDLAMLGTSPEAIVDSAEREPVWVWAFEPLAGNIAFDFKRARFLDSYIGASGVLAQLDRLSDVNIGIVVAGSRQIRIDPRHRQTIE